MDTIDEYLRHIRVDQRSELERIRKIVAKTVPDAVEAISYGMPAFKYKRKYLIGFAAYKDHLSVFPTPQPIIELQDKLAGYKLAKGTIQCTLDNPLPEELIKDLLAVRLAVIDK